MKEGLSVKYIVTIIWGLILSQVTYYLGSALSQTPYNVQSAVLVCTHEEYYSSFCNVLCKAQKDRGQTKNHRDSMVEVIATSNRCELLTLEFHF